MQTKNAGKNTYLSRHSLQIRSNCLPAFSIPKSRKLTPNKQRMHRSNFALFNWRTYKLLSLERWINIFSHIPLWSRPGSCFYPWGPSVSLEQPSWPNSLVWIRIPVLNIPLLYFKCEVYGHERKITAITCYKTPTLLSMTSPIYSYCGSSMIMYKSTKRLQSLCC